MDRRTLLAGLAGTGVIGLGVRGSTQFAAETSDEAACAGSNGSASPPASVVRSGTASVLVRSVPLGAGGFVTGLDVSSDSLRLACRTDVGNAYVRDRSDTAWRPLFSPTSMRPEDVDPLPALGDKADSLGVAAIRIAPSNKDIIYASFCGYIWRSDDGGRSIRRTSLKQKKMLANAGWQRLYNHAIDIHPRDPNRVLVGTWGEGTWFTADGGRTWSALALPAARPSKDDQPGLTTVLFDPAGGERIYVFVSGVGLLCSTTGGQGPFVQLPGGPARCAGLIAGARGSVLMCEQTREFTGKVYRYSPADGWRLHKSDREMISAADDPANPQQMVFANADGHFSLSADGGETIRGIADPIWLPCGSEVGWVRTLDHLYPSEVRFDKTRKGVFWMAQGVGIVEASVSGTTIALRDISAGIEELVAVDGVSVPGGKTFFTAWDKPFWRLDSPDRYVNDFRVPLRAGQTHDEDLVVFSSSIDFAPGRSDVLVGLSNQTDRSGPGVTHDGGNNWKAFSGQPAGGWGNGGVIAAGSERNFVVLTSNGGGGFVTSDGGDNWQPIRLDGGAPTLGFSPAYYVRRKSLAADKQRPGTFALVYTVGGGGGTNGFGGVWVTRDGGAHWVQTLRGVINAGQTDPNRIVAPGQDLRQFWQCELAYVPGFAGELVYTPHADQAADRFFWSADDGASWKIFGEGLTNVKSFSFGKAAPQASRPALYLWGKYRSKEGLYATFDWFRTEPLLLTRFPNPALGSVSCITADANIFGRVYVGTGGTGWSRVDLQA